MRTRIMQVVLVVFMLSGAMLFAGGQGEGAGRTEVRWFVGLGAGSDEPTFLPQRAVVDRFNESQDEIRLVLEIVDNSAAFNTLATQISGGNAPDIVGPVGIRGRDSFRGAWRDLSDLVESQNYDLTQFDESMVEFYRDPTEGLVGLPFAIYPSYLYVNEELFAEAGIPLPPQEYGMPYVDWDGNEREWNLDTVREIGLILTVDANGYDATDSRFDPGSITQWGFGSQWSDARAWATMFGAGNFVDLEGNAVIPEHWLEGWKWLYRGMWEDHFIPNGPYGSSDIVGQGNWFASGRVAMVQTHLWYAGFAEMNFDWDIYPMASYNGVTTAKMHADTFVITQQSKNPEAAFTVLTYLLGDASSDLLKIYGGMPARTELQEDFLESFFSQRYPNQNITTRIVSESIPYADNPSHEGWMPSFQESSNRYNEFWDLLQNESGLDVAAEAERLRRDLAQIFAAYSN
ncbi:ABC transporter substrate-binding protein [Spirochaeta dissipatitropha]